MKFNLIFILLIFIIFTHAFSYMRFDNIVEGQLGKQTFAAEMIRSWSLERTSGGFPIRSFLELHHSGPIPWAEEFPLYSFLAVAVMSIAGINEVLSGRLVSLLSLLFLFFLIWNWTKTHSKKIGLNSHFQALWAVCCLGSAAVLHYSKSVMPDFPMFVFCFWGLILAEQKKWMQSRFVFMIAALFKYYAIFPMLGIALWQFFNERKNIKELSKSAILWFLFVVPPVIYVAMFLKLNVPNPISEYRESDGHGHLSNFSFLFQLHFYQRWFTWVLVKLTTLGGGIMAVVGIVMAIRTNKLSQWYWFWLATATGFSFLFAPSFFVHDYYALMFLPLIWLGWGYFLNALSVQFAEKKLFPIILLVFTVLFVFWNQAHAHFQNRRETVLLNAVDFQEKCLNNNSAAFANHASDYGIFISTYSQPILPFLSRRVGWMVALPQLQQPENVSLLKQRLLDPRTQYVVKLIQKDVNFQFDLGQSYKEACSADLGKALISVYIKSHN